VKTGKWTLISVLAALCLSLPFAGVVFANGLKPPRIPDGEVSRYHVYERADKGQSESFVSPREEVQEVRQIITTFEKDGQHYYRFFRAERMAGGHTNYYTYIFQNAEPFRFVVFNKMVQSQSGRIVHDETTYFDDPGHPFPEDMNHFYSIPMAIRGLALAPGAKENLQIWFSGHFTPWQMGAVVEGEELVKVPAGSFRCWRVKVDPDLKAIFKHWYWLSLLFKNLVPSYYYWLNVEAPHVLVKFEGRFGPVGFSAVQVQELTAVGTATEEDRELLRRFSPTPEILHFYPVPKTLTH
jgi:hypothetical protein